jgi:branched-chain amino acid transport system permease protein
MALVLQSTLSGLLAGGLYALLGAGLSLAFGAARVVNLAHGPLALLGAYASWALARQLGWDPWLSAAVAAPALFACGVLLERAAGWRAAGGDPGRRLLATLGLGLALSGALATAVGPGPHALAPARPFGHLSLLGLSAPVCLLVSFAAAAALLLALLLFLHRSHAGRAIRAAAQDPEAAQLLGLDVRRTSALAFGIGAALAGTAGALAAPAGALDPQGGVGATLRALAMALLGGMGVAGAALGGLALGVAEGLAAALLGGGELVAPVLVLLLLVARPSGRLGEERP